MGTTGDPLSFSRFGVQSSTSDTGRGGRRSIPSDLSEEWIEPKTKGWVFLFYLQGRHSLWDKFISPFSLLLTILEKCQIFSVYLSFSGQWHEFFRHVIHHQGFPRKVVFDFSDGFPATQGFRLPSFLVSTLFSSFSSGLVSSVRLGSSGRYVFSVIPVNKSTSPFDPLSFTLTGPTRPLSKSWTTTIHRTHTGSIGNPIPVHLLFRLCTFVYKVRGL